MIVTDLYSTRIQKTFDEDQAEIVSILKANPGKKLKLINYYKGLPLSYPATVASIDKGIVDLDVQKEQALAIKASHSVFIRSEIFKHDVFAQVQFVDIKRGAASFVKFTYVEIMAERRDFIRMEPHMHPVVTIDSPFGIFDGTLCDISISGANVSILDSCPLETDSNASIRFMLGDMEQDHRFEVTAPSRLTIIKGDTLPRNYIFALTPDKSLDRQLSQYIFQRQIEIVREIKDAVA